MCTPYVSVITVEQRCHFDRELRRRTRLPLIPSGGLSSIHWREAWKYGERAYRYCRTMSAMRSPLSAMPRQPWVGRHNLLTSG